MKIINIEDSDYPYLLKRIQDPPINLYVEGNIENLNKDSIAIIGSRNCTENGRNIAYNFAQELSMQNLVITSGLAIGIDTAAHEGTVSVNEKTIAVLGCGFNNIFPEENVGLYKNILKTGGTIISEYAPDVIAKSEYFLRRNRIVSGLSIGVLVIEAQHRSGTSVTAKIARLQGKKVFCIPHNIEEINGIGTNKLIQEGAKLVTNVQDIIEEFNFLSYKKIEIKESAISPIEKMINETYDIIKTKFNKEHLFIYKIIEQEKLNINELSRKSKIDISKLSSILFALEVEGLIKRMPGNYYICIKEKINRKGKKCTKDT